MASRDLSHAWSSPPPIKSTPPCTSTTTHHHGNDEALLPPHTHRHCLPNPPSLRQFPLHQPQAHPSHQRGRPHPPPHPYGPPPSGPGRHPHSPSHPYGPPPPIPTVPLPPVPVVTPILPPVPVVTPVLPPIPVVTPILPPVPVITPVLPKPTPKTQPGTGCRPAPPKKKSAKCPIDMVKLGACLDVLGKTIHLGDPAVDCCPLIAGMASTEAAMCLCTTIKLKVLGLKVFMPIAVELLITCGKTPPPGYSCA